MIEKLKKELEPIVVKHECTLFDILYEKERNEYYLRVIIEKDGGLDINTCSEVSEEVSDKLDELDLIDNEYYLEVTSPGIERPLRNIEEVKNAIEEYIHIDLYNPTKGIHELDGTLIDVKDNVLYMQYFLKGVRKKIDIPYENIKNARLAVKF